MNRMNRRRFLGRSAVAAGAASLGPFALRARGANDTIRVAVAGLHNQGRGLAGRFQAQEGVQVVALCDPDSEVLVEQLAALKSRHSIADRDLQGCADIRAVLDRKDVDAIVIAAPNHWHALMTVWACQAGKHVYVEKPVSHSIWEGRKMIEAARRYNRIVQAGTQQRSCPAVQEAARDLQAGKYGRILWAHCCKLQAREPIGKVDGPRPPPASVDYNLWAGPAPMSPILREQFHYDWHWQWAWGDGELANWGVHYLADLHCLLGWKDVPQRVVSAGNRFAWNDDGETPNMHLALLYHDDLPVVIDIRNLPDPGRPGGAGGAVFHGARHGNTIQCEHATVRLARGGGGAYDADGQRIHQYKGDGGAAHVANFIGALRSGRREDLNAEIEAGHQSTVLCHQANIAWRVGQTAPIDRVRESFKSSEDAQATLTDMLAQLDGNHVDLNKHPFLLGPMFEFDRATERFTGPNADLANAYVRCPHREPFVIRD